MRARKAMGPFGRIVRDAVESADRARRLAVEIGAAEHAEVAALLAGEKAVDAEIHLLRVVLASGDFDPLDGVESNIIRKCRSKGVIFGGTLYAAVPIDDADRRLAEGQRDPAGRHVMTLRSIAMTDVVNLDA